MRGIGNDGVGDTRRLATTSALDPAGVETEAAAAGAHPVDHHARVGAGVGATGMPSGSKERAGRLALGVASDLSARRSASHRFASLRLRGMPCDPFQCLEQAVQVAWRHLVDLGRIERWARNELAHGPDRFRAFERRLRGG